VSLRDAEQAHAESELWDCTWDRGDLHIVPVDDEVGHDLDQDCICGPYFEDLGGGERLLAHYALDRRP